MRKMLLFYACSGHPVRRGWAFCLCVAPATVFSMIR